MQIILSFGVVFFHVAITTFYLLHDQQAVLIDVFVHVNAVNTIVLAQTSMLKKIFRTTVFYSTFIHVQIYKNLDVIV